VRKTGLGLYDDLTVTENLQFATTAYHARAAALDDTALAAHADTLVRDLSLGLRRRLAFTAALAHNPALLVLDEPTAGVDPLARSRLWDLIREQADRGAGVLVSTHYMEEAEHCDRVVVLVEGRVAVSDTPANIVAGRHALEVRTSRWDLAFDALDKAGFVTALHGRTLRILGGNQHHVAQLLHDADIDAAVAAVPATLEEAFVQISAGTDRHGCPYKGTKTSLGQDHGP
jgi:ABC-2 type transport system ATP-binding protein